MSDRKTGTIKKYLDGKGFGFIETQKGDLFFHINDSEGFPEHLLEEDLKVSYELGKDQRSGKTKAFDLKIED
jgi:CspA family cold shock protein